MQSLDSTLCTVQSVHYVQFRRYMFTVQTVHYIQLRQYIMYNLDSTLCIF